MPQDHTYLLCFEWSHLVIYIPFFIKKSFLFKCVCTRACVCVPHVCGCLKMPEEGVGWLGAEVTGGCELPSLGTGNKTWVLWKSSKNS